MLNRKYSFAPLVSVGSVGTIKAVFRLPSEPSSKQASQTFHKASLDLQPQRCFKMAEQPEKDVEQESPDAEDDDNPNYQPPAPKALDEILNQDKEDESLENYKKALLGDGGGGHVHDEKNPKNAIIQKLSLLVEGRDEVSIDLTKPEDEIKKECFTIKEGCKYRIKIYFFVQREIVTGLRYEHRVYRKGIHVDKMIQMMGSYGPKAELQSFITQTEDAPSGMLMRGDYKIKSRFLDDDRNEYFNWEWHLAVKKDW